MKYIKKFLQIILAILVIAISCLPAHGEEKKQHIVNVLAYQNDIPDDSDIYNTDLYDFDSSKYTFTKNTPKLRISHATYDMAEKDYMTAINESRALNDEKSINTYIVFSQNPFILNGELDSNGDMRYTVTDLEDAPGVYSQIVNDIRDSKIYESYRYNGETVKKVYCFTLLGSFALFYVSEDSTTVCFYASDKFITSNECYYFTAEAFSALVWQYNDYIDFVNADYKNGEFFNTSFENFLKYGPTRYNQYVQKQSTYFSVCAAMLGVLVTVCIAVCIVYIVKKRKKQHRSIK